MQTKDPTLMRIYKEVAEEFDIEPNVVNKVVSHAFTTAKRTMRDDADIPIIRLQYLGSFQPKLYRVEKHLRKLIYIRKNNKETKYTPEELYDLIYQLLQVRKRLIKEYFSQKTNKEKSKYDQRLH